MKHIYLAIFIVMLLAQSCIQESQQGIYATNGEKAIIDNMDCWESVVAESILTVIVFEKNNRKKDKKWNDWHKHKNTALKKGQTYLCNDTTFIEITRNDSLYDSLISKRVAISKNLVGFKNKIPFFSKIIDKITSDAVEYKYYSSGSDFGIYEKPFKKDFIILNNEFYLNYSDYLKEGFSLPENSNIKEEDVLSLNNLLKQLEKIDRKIWAVKYYMESKKDLEANKLEQKRSDKVDSLFNE